MTLSEVIEESVVEILKNVELVAMDVDGVLTDGRLTFSEQGREIKSFHVHDGYGIKQLIANGIEVAIITGRESSIVSQRANELGINHVIQGSLDKAKSLRDLLEQLKIPSANAVFIGDDMPDLPAMQLAGLGISVNNAIADVKQAFPVTTTRSGGEGAVREFCDLLLTVKLSEKP